MTNINYKSGIAIGQLIAYLPILAVAILLAVRHGFGRSSGWFFLIIFAVVRIVGACFQLATINDITNASLNTGVAILQAIGLSPLELCSLGLLSRIISSINKSHSTPLQPRYMRLIQTVCMVGLILSIIGGINASQDLVNKGVYTPQALSKAGLGLFIASYVLIMASTIILSFSVAHAEDGEKRLLLAVAVSLPFILIRLIYSCLSSFGTNPDFNPIFGNPTIFLCMALIMELCVVIIYEGVGLTLRKVYAAPAFVNAETVAPDGTAAYVKGPSKTSQIAGTLGRRTLIGRLIHSAVGGRQDDMEMQGKRRWGQGRGAQSQGY